MRLGEVGRRAAQHLVLLLEQPNTLLSLTQLGRLRRRHSQPLAGLDVSGLQPVAQAGVGSTNSTHRHMRPGCSLFGHDARVRAMTTSDVGQPDVIPSDVPGRYACPECGNERTGVDRYGNWWTHSSHKKPSEQCPLGGESAGGLRPSRDPSPGLSGQKTRKHPCPECGRSVQVSTRGTWYSHQRGDRPLELCRLSAISAAGLAADPRHMSVRGDDHIEQAETQTSRPFEPAMLRGDEESTSIRTVGGGLPSLGRRR